MFISKICINFVNEQINIEIMGTFKNYPNKVIKPHVNGLKYLNLTTELADKIALDYDVFVMVDEWERNYLLIDLGNEYAIELEINEYQKNKFIFKCVIDSFVNVKELFKYNGNNVFTYSKNGIKKIIDFYTNAYNDVIQFEEIAKIEMLNKHNDLLSQGFIYAPNTIENKDYFHFGLYYYQSVKINPYVSIIEGIPKFELRLEWFNKPTKITETELFKESLEHNRIISYIDIERSFSGLNNFKINELSLIKYDICLNIMRSINFNYDLNPVWGIKFVYINKYNTYFIYNNEKYSDIQLINKLDVSTLLEIRKLLLHILKINEQQYQK